MPQVLRSPGALFTVPWIGRANALSRTGEVDHALDLRGCPFLVGKGSHEYPVADGAILTIGREPGVPSTCDPLRRPPPLLKLLRLRQGPLADLSIAVVTGDPVVPRGWLSSRTEEHVPHSEAAADARSRT
jgi:hypothetical protein